jgi:hypothetical protein
MSAYIFKHAAGCHRLVSSQIAAGEQPWRWGKTWWMNEVAWLKFLIPITLALNIPLSAAAIFKSAKRECKGLKATYRAFR